MLKEILEKIRSVESVSEEMIRQANAEAKKIISDASYEAFQIMQRAAEENEKEYIDIREKLSGEALAEAAAIESDAKKQIADLKKNTSLKIDSAVEYIVKRTLEINVDN